jgi:PTH1 family peptidyl-tRNA hydrolase
MNKPDFFVIGLGNPGDKYKFTRHNLGKLFIEWLSLRLKKEFVLKKQHQFFDVAFSFSNKNIIVRFVKSDFFMNQSGLIIDELKDEIDSVEKILIVHDDMDEGFGVCKIRDNKSRGLRGHNGNRSVFEAFKKYKKFNSEIVAKMVPYFMSLGIGRPEENVQISDFVLNDFKLDEVHNNEEKFISAEVQLELFLQKMFYSI